MKRKLWIIILLLFFVIGSVLIFHKKEEEVFTNNKKHLYEKAIQYLEEHNEDPDQVKEGYHLFFDYHGFGTTKDEKYQYAYMHISEEAYYVSNHKIISASGSSILYRFTFDELDHVIKVEIPMDGSYYTESVYQLFPNSIEKKAIRYQPNNHRLLKKVKQYYSYLEDTNIYYREEEKNG